MTKKIKAVVAMSGGVDSGVAALLLKKQGYEVIGFHCHFWSESLETRENKCCSTESLEAARQTAYQLDIPFYTIDFTKDFKKQVVDYFISEYKRGRTPNPCVMCNKFIKFGRLLDYTKSLGCDYLATGHYARVVEESRSPREHLGGVCRSHLRGGGIGELKGPKRQNPQYHLFKGIDKTKDQSYFLWTLTQKQLKHILFPIGELTKAQVRKIASEKKLPVAQRPESFEICFIPGKDYREFMRRNVSKALRPGLVLNTQGEMIGEHEGLPLYTIGQRHGFRINKRIQNSEFRIQEKGGSKLVESKGYIPPLYVVGIDLKKNALIVGRGVESERKEFEVEEVNWIDKEEIERLRDWEIKCEVRIRHQGELIKSNVKSLKSKVKVTLDEPVRGITPGQTAVFYRGDEVLGGGIIKS